jgi:hypothetical protein
MSLHICSKKVVHYRSVFWRKYVPDILQKNKSDQLTNHKEDEILFNFLIALSP